MNYPSLSAFLSDPSAPIRPELPPGGSVGPKDDDHMTYLAMTIRNTPDRAERLRKLANYAELLAQHVGSEEPCLQRVLAWHGEIIGAA